MDSSMETIATISKKNKGVLTISGHVGVRWRVWGGHRPDMADSLDLDFDSGC